MEECPAGQRQTQPEHNCVFEETAAAKAIRMPLNKDLNSCLG